MSNFHKDQNEANLHNAKGFSTAANGTICVRNEAGQQIFEKPFGYPSAINFVDGNAAPPTVANGDVYVLIDLGNGAVHADWSTGPGSTYNDWVKKTNFFWVPRTPVEGMQCYNKATGAFWYFDGSDWVSIEGGTNLGNILFVSTTGSNTETRANAIGNMNKPLTPEQARAVALSGDTVHVLSGSYTLTLTGVNGYAKDGVNWFLYPKAIFNKATSGAMFNTAGFSTGTNVFGFGEFYGTGSCGRIFHDGMSNKDYTFEGVICENAVASCHESATNNAGVHNIRFKTRIKSTFSYGILPAGGTAFIDCPEIISTATNAAFFYQNTHIFLNGLKVENTTGGVGLETATVGKCVFNLSYINQAYLRSAVGIVGNFNSDKVTFDGISNAGNLVVSGQIFEYVHVSGHARLSTVNKATLTGEGTVAMDYIPQQTITIGGTSDLEVTMACKTFSSGSGTVNVNNSKAKLFLNGYLNTQLSLNLINGYVKLNGILVPKGFTTFGSDKYVIYQSGGTFDLGESGCIDMKDIATNEVKAIWKQGGTFISNGGRIILQNATQIPVGDSASVQNIKLYSGGVNTNDVDFLGVRTGTLGLTNLITGTAPTYDADIIS